MPLLSEDARRQIARDGFTVLPDLFTRAEMESLALDLQAFDARETARARDGQSHGLNHADVQVFATHLAEKDEAIRAFATRRPEIVAIATEWLGPDVDLYYNQSVFKKPEGDKIFPWHQDDAYTPVFPAGYLTLWLAITDATPENGCISVLPGSHVEGLRKHELTPYGLAGHSADDPDQGLQVPVKAGSLILFSSLTLHKSGPNRSKDERKAMVLQYAASGLRFAETGERVPDLLPVARGGEVAEWA